MPYETVREKKAHPSTFPLKLAEMCLKLSGMKEGGLVLDPFAGICTVGLAAKNLGLDFVGFEIDPEYCSTARENTK